MRELDRMAKGFMKQLLKFTAQDWASSLSVIALAKNLSLKTSPRAPKGILVVVIGNFGDAKVLAQSCVTVWLS